MEQDLAWRQVRKQEEKETKMQENYNNKFVSESITTQKTSEVQMGRTREDTRKKTYQSELKVQMNSNSTQKQVSKVTEKTLEM